MSFQPVLQASLTIRITSVASNGFASTSYVPRFKASAHKRASASPDVTIKSGGSGKSEMCSNISRRQHITLAGYYWHSSLSQSGE